MRPFRQLFSTQSAPATSQTSSSNAVDPTFRQWVLLYGNRRWIAFFISAMILLLLLVIGTIFEFEMERLVTETRAVQALFNTLLGGVILFVSVVLSINTAALSQEFGTLQVKQAQIVDSIEFQMELEEIAQLGVSPAGIGPFFAFILRALRRETDQLKRGATDVSDADQRDSLLSLVENVEAELSKIENRLRADNRRLSTVLLAGLDYDYASHINAARRLQAELSSALPERKLKSLNNLSEVLVLFASGREYFTTLYFKRELRNLSNDLLILALPVIVFTAYVLLAIDAGLFPRFTVLSIERRFLYIAIAFVVALSPYVLLSSYMLRIVTVSKHSLESTGFTLEDEDLRLRP
ncbi:MULTISPECIES: hypothetical protein [unclassified Haladaptatus]|uniref:hypothetical protein n=1 Tax=unclassified Haladaptatus TaxID=2622732 RepID=UPI0023E8D39D|nr:MULTISPECIES: hypothetical protein [unclassified Haladaptatus]